ncbi:MAG: histidinol phosphate phosphatase domain-containing protein [Nitrospirae bacterium]|nr:histidinol phosphate phosphatase domain-containing protein [Nitrospirota bacterium]
MIDLHTHTVFSDGELIPAELVRRAQVLGLRAIAITDHMDSSNLDFIIPRVVKVAEELNRILPIKVIPGTELTHVPPELIPEKISLARKLGAKLVVIHGETIVEPVCPGTNRAGIIGGADIIAHPGLITEEDAKLAAEHGVMLEISARKGHSLANGHVVRVARKHNVRLVINTDAHSPGDLINREFATKVLLAAGLDNEELNQVFSNAEELAARI